MVNFTIYGLNTSLYYQRLSLLAAEPLSAGTDQEVEYRNAPRYGYDHVRPVRLTNFRGRLPARGLGLKVGLWTFEHFLSLYTVPAGTSKEHLRSEERW